MTRRPLLLGAVLLQLLPLARTHAQESDAEWLRNCRSDRYNNHGDLRARVCEVRQIRIAPRALDVAPGRNGGVEVYGGTSSDIVIHARVQVNARTDALARSTAQAVRIDTSGQITATGPEDDDARWWVSFAIHGPSRMDITATTRNGPILVQDVGGTMRLRTQNGPIDLDGASGDVTARLQNGPLNVRLTGTTWSGAGLDAETVNGPVNLRIPEGYNARLESGTRNGPMSVGFPINVTLDGKVFRRIATTLGRGGAVVRAVTTNGPVDIDR